MKEKTLEQEFPIQKTLKKEGWKGKHELDLLQSFRFAQILRFIIENKARLEQRDSLDSDNWRPGTIRQFLRFATGLPKGEDPKQTSFQDYLRWWRIKRTPTRTELERIITIDEKEEL